MKTVFVDTNIVLDVLLLNEGLWQESRRILKLAEYRYIRACVSASSMTDIFYVVAKNLSMPNARSAIEKLLQIFEIVSVGKEDLEGALSIPILDFEDALQMWCAKKIGADVLITRDVEGFAGTDIKVASPNEFEG
jgi:predicted nucleic acid-binding protein